MNVLRLLLVAFAVAAFLPQAAAGELAGKGSLYSVIEVPFNGPRQGPSDAPARQIELQARFRHESGSPEFVVHGFWDGDGHGAAEGEVYKVRFCPTRAGRWTLKEVKSNSKELDHQREGDYVEASPSSHPGFWIVDDESPNGRWYRRSDGSHPYVFGNTHYSFLSGMRDQGQPSGNDIAADIVANAKHFKKLRFGISGDYYPHPKEKPFLDDQGRPTDNGDYSHRPNPAWFSRRVDVAVKAAYEHDLIADLILAGPDTEASRSTLRARHNSGDATPFLKYMAARYGAFPNVWLCLCNEYDIRTPKFTEEELGRLGSTLRSFLPYPTPLSVHATPGILWSARFDALPPWHDHQIIQKKLRTLAPSADVMAQVAKGDAGQPRSKPTINDELSYQGDGDKHRRDDTLESHLGAFLGGGYGSTGFKPGNKTGQYFWGKFDADEHTAAVGLGWLRETIDREISFWKMQPDLSIFSSLDPGFRGMAWSGQEYVLGTNKRREGIAAELPEGRWRVTCHDVIARESKTLAENASGRFTFDSPSSRAVLFHFLKH